MDFKAVVKTASGEHKKLLIELQKSNHPFDIMRFRQYLGSNYTQDDEVDGVPTSLPLLLIYFLGFSLSVKRPVLKIGRSYQDVGTGEVLPEKDPFIENLSHDCFIIQIPSLAPQVRTRLEKLLSVFNQKFLFDTDQKWLLSHPGDFEDAELRPLLRRLSMAAESPEVQEQIVVEQQFDNSMEKALREQERIIQQKDTELQQKDSEIQQEKQRAEALRQRIAELEKRLNS
ncbi:MAG: hypothetical protein ACK4Q5_11690 [Saprospiraceae bacterium]